MLLPIACTSIHQMLPPMLYAVSHACTRHMSGLSWTHLKSLNDITHAAGLDTQRLDMSS